MSLLEEMMMEKRSLCIQDISLNLMLAVEKSYATQRFARDMQEKVILETVNLISYFRLIDETV